MKSEPARRPMHPALPFLWLTPAVMLASWILCIYGVEMPVAEGGETAQVQSLLSPEGLRWLLRNVMENFVLFPPLGAGVMLLFGTGVLWHSGFLGACGRTLAALTGRHTPTTRRETRALLPACLACLLYWAAVLWCTFSSRGFLLNAFGGVERSAFAEAMVFLPALGAGITGAVYGHFAGRYGRFSEVMEDMSHPASLLGTYLVAAFFASQLFACLDYSLMGGALPAWLLHTLRWTPLAATVLWHISIRKCKNLPHR